MSLICIWNFDTININKMVMLYCLDNTTISNPNFIKKMSPIENTNFLLVMGAKSIYKYIISSTKPNSIYKTFNF